MNVRCCINDLISTSAGVVIAELHDVRIDQPELANRFRNILLVRKDNVEIIVYLDILCAGDAHERAEVVQQQMADGRLDRLRRRLVKIHKEELEDGYDTADVA